MQHAVETEQSLTTSYVLDGGSLLHSLLAMDWNLVMSLDVTWAMCSSTTVACNVAVVFDGYAD